MTNWEKIYSQGNEINQYPYDLLVSLMPREKGRVLDLGCGAGNNAKFLVNIGHDVYGIDASKTAIELCKDIKGDFRTGDLKKLPYKSNFFNYVVDRESVYANSFKDVQTILFEVRRVLKKDGVFISFWFNQHHPHPENLSTKTYTLLDIKKIGLLFKDFKIKNIISHSYKEIFSKRLRDFNEYIIIVKKI